METRKFMLQNSHTTNSPFGTGKLWKWSKSSKTHQENLPISDPRPFCYVKTATALGKSSNVYHCVIYCPKVFNSARNFGVILAKPFILAGIRCIFQRKSRFLWLLMMHWWNTYPGFPCFEKWTFFPVKSSISAISRRIWTITKGNFTKEETCERRNLVQ